MVSNGMWCLEVYGVQVTQYSDDAVFRGRSVQVTQCSDDAVFRRFVYADTVFIGSRWCLGEAIFEGICCLREVMLIGRHHSGEGGVQE